MIAIGFWLVILGGLVGSADHDDWLDRLGHWLAIVGVGLLLVGLTTCAWRSFP